jgi:hypothetical protein
LSLQDIYRYNKQEWRRDEQKKLKSQQQKSKIKKKIEKQTMKRLFVWMLLLPFAQNAFLPRISRKTATNQVTIHGNYIEIGNELDANQNTDAEVILIRKNKTR